jgi:hypothetical protein
MPESLKLLTTQPLSILQKVGNSNNTFVRPLFNFLIISNGGVLNNTYIMILVTCLRAIGTDK